MHRISSGIQNGATNRFIHFYFLLQNNLAYLNPTCNGLYQLGKELAW